jgi:hypothetical protein
MRLALDSVNALWYVLTSVAGLAMAAVMRRGTTVSVKWWEWLGLAGPLAIWTCVFAIPQIREGRKSLANLSEPLYLGIVVGRLGIILPGVGARRVPPAQIRVAFVVASCVAALLVALFTPMLPE